MNYEPFKIINFRYIFTPIATAYYIINGIKRKQYFIFGIRVIDLSV